MTKKHNILKGMMLLAALLVFQLAPSTAKAQESAAYADNTFFLSVGAGATYNMPGNTLGMPSGGLYLSRWLMKPLAFRVAAELVSGPAMTTNDGGTATAMSFLGSAQFMWDVNATFFYVYNKTFQYPCPIYPLIGLGAILTFAGGDQYTSDFQAMLGFHLPIRLGPKWDFFLEYKCFFMPESYIEDAANVSYMHTGLVGFTRRWSDNPYHRRTGFESRNTSEDWFTGFGVGALFNSYEFEYIFNKGTKLWNITGDMMVGRNYSNIWTIRFELSGFFARHRAHMGQTPILDDAGVPVVDGNGTIQTTDVMQPGNLYIFNALHTDFMINLSHLGNFRRGKKWNILPYLCAGPVWRYKDPEFGLGADAGIMFRRYIDNMGDFFFDAKYIMVPPRIAGGTGPNGSMLGTGYLMFTIGYISNWGHSTTRYRMPVNSCVD
jgi:hypothetical protein